MRASLPVTALLALSVCAAPATGQDDPPEPDYEISVKPRLCIVDKRTPICESLFRVSWRASETGYYCVLTGSSDGALRCWPSHDSGRVEHERRVSEDVTYTLNEGEDGPALAAATVEILQKGSDDRRRRRRTRYVWDVL